MSVQRIRTKVLAGATALAIGAGLFAGLAPLASRASSHREAPLTAADPQIDSTDLYAFVSPDRPDSVTLVSTWIPFENPAGGPNFFPWAENTNYDIRISNDGGTNADIVYRWKFTTHYRNPNTFLYNTGPVTSLNDPDLNLYQTYDLWRIAGGHKTQLLDNAPVSPSNVGGASMPNYNSNLFDKAVLENEVHLARLRTRRTAGWGRPTIRSSWTCVCSTSSTERTSRRPGTTRWPAST